MQKTKFKSLLDFQEAFPTEEACLKYWAEIRWKGKVVSPYDPVSQVYKCKDGRYKCRNTNKYFNSLTKSMFENTKLPLKKWFLALFIFGSSKKSISSYQLAEYINVTPKTGWFLLHRLRLGFDCPIFKVLLKDFVEADETYIGGKNKNRHWDKKVPHSQGRSNKDKTPVFGMLERGGNLIAQVVPNTKKKTIKSIIKANVKESSTLYTDEWHAYRSLYKNYDHQIVNHRKKQYVNEQASTNGLENVWSNFKRMIGGTYHRVSKKHLQSYVDEFAFRFNTRKFEEQDKFDLVLSSMINKRLTYRELVG